MIIMTIKKESTKAKREAQLRWNELLKVKRDYHDENPSYPPIFQTGNQKGEVGEYLYVVYDGEIIGYGMIGKVEEGNGTRTCGGMRQVSSKYWCQLTRELLEMPYHVPCDGFRPPKKKDVNLHECGQKRAIEIIKGMGLYPESVRAIDAHVSETIVRKKK